MALYNFHLKTTSVTKTQLTIAFFINLSNYAVFQTFSCMQNATSNIALHIYEVGKSLGFGSFSISWARYISYVEKHYVLFLDTQLFPWV